MIAVGVDTHKHRHVVVALDGLGQVLGEIVIAATMAGYRELVVWLARLDAEVVVGIEGAGSYGAGLCQHLRGAGLVVVEVERPRRRDRRAGKSGPDRRAVGGQAGARRRWRLDTTRGRQSRRPPCPFGGVSLLRRGAHPAAQSATKGCT